MKAKINQAENQSFISIVVSFRNESKNLEKHVQALCTQNYPKDKYEVVFVDDGSTDDSLQIVKNEISKTSFPSVRLIHLNWAGTAAARNEGVKKAKGEIMAITDADAVPDPNWLCEISNSFKNEEIGMVCGKIKEINDLCEVDQQSAHTTYEKTFWFTNVSFNRTVFEKIGGFDRRFRRGSDYDFIVRLLDAGFEYTYNPNAVVWHIKPPLTLSKALKDELKNGKADLLFLTVDARIFLRNLTKIPLSTKRAVTHTLATLFSAPLLIVAFLLGGIPGLLFATVLIAAFIVTRVHMSKTKRFRLLRACACIPISIALWYHLLKSITLAFHKRSGETHLS